MRYRCSLTDYKCVPRNVPCDHRFGRYPLHSALTYTLLDIAGSLWGTLVFAAAFVAPGYVAGSLLNIAGFRHKSLAEQAAWSIALSLGLGTIFIVASAWMIGITFTGVLLAIVSLAALALLKGSATSLERISTRGALLIIGWILLVVLSLVDIGAGSRLWMSVTSFDHSVRTALVDTVMRTGVVPVNPLYWPGHDAPLRYYYFWYVTCAVIAKLAHISARQAFIASCVWPAFAVVGMLGLYGKYLLGWSGKDLRSRTRLSVILLAVTGLDALVTLFNWLAGGATPGDMEWWSIDQITSWLDTFLWVPHHAAALVCCLLCFLLVWMARTEPQRSQRAIFAVVAGLSFASAFGLSIYVAIGFCLVMFAWLLRIVVLAWRKQGSAKTPLTAAAIAAVIAIFALSPYIAQLRRGTVSDGSSQHLLNLSVRQMLDPDMLSGAPLIRQLGTSTRNELSALILLLPGYAIELGFFALAILLIYRRKEKSEGERTLLFLFAATLVSVSFLRSAVINTNDYGVRASLLAQFAAVLLAARAWEASAGFRRSALLALAIVGVCGTAYQAVALRLFLPWQQAHGNPAMHDLAERNYAIRAAYTLFAQHAPATARLQYNTTAGGYFNYPHIFDAQHQIVTAGTVCDTGFGGEQAPCDAILNTVQALYAPPYHLAPSAAIATVLCSRIGIQYLVVTRWDSPWNAPSGWVWQLPTTVVTPDVRIVACSAP